MQPSLSAQQGQVVGQPVIFSDKIYKKVRVLATCNMRMETAATLVLRKVLNPDIASHQAIIDQSAEPHEAPQNDSHQVIPATEVSTVHKRLPAQQVGIKREHTTSTSASSRMIKREPAALCTCSSAARLECIDLT